MTWIDACKTICGRCQKTSSDVRCLLCFFFLNCLVSTEMLLQKKKKYITNYSRDSSWGELKGRSVYKEKKSNDRSVSLKTPWSTADNWTDNKGHNKRMEDHFGDIIWRKKKGDTKLKAKISTTLPCVLDNHDLAEGVQKRKRRADITNKKSKNTKNCQRSPESSK